MKLSNNQKAVRFFRVLLRYGAEVLIIFIGITISFLFEQWRVENQQKKELIELSESLIRDAETLKLKLAGDLKGSAEWIQDLDSIHAQRKSNRVSERHLKWLYQLISGQDLFNFDSQSPSYLSATNSGMLEKLPDSIQHHIYNLYHVELRYFQLLYDQQWQNITQFRNHTLISSEVDLYDKNAAGLQVDLKKFGQEVQKPVYGNFILEIRSLEKQVYRINEDASVALAKLITSLQGYRNALKS